MSLKFAILGFLSLEALTGYTLKKKYFDGSVGHFWPADQTQIYRTLQKLELDGEAVSEEVAGGSRPNQRQYTITDKGRSNLGTWLEETHAPNPLRSTFLVQIYFSRLISESAFNNIVETELNRREIALRAYEEIDLNPENAASDDLRRQLEFGQMTLDYAIRKETMEIDWLKTLLKKRKQIQ